MKLYRREKYLSKIRGFYHDTGLIKVITGIRRCGKSCLMETIAEELKDSGISPDNIKYINLDKRGFKSIKTEDQLEAVIDQLFTSVKGTKCICQLKIGPRFYSKNGPLNMVKSMPSR